jgi:hypothetical protein
MTFGELVPKNTVRRIGLGAIALAALLALLAPVCARAQDDDSTSAPEKHGRKYKAPPETSHIEVLVQKASNKKPIDAAHVIFHPVINGEDQGNYEVKTHPDGKVTIDVIPIGSAVRVQVIADGYATYAEDYTIKEATREIVISLVRPRAQISTYVDNEGKPTDMQPGVQEPIRPKPAAPPASSGSGSSGSGSTGSSSAPPAQGAGSGSSNSGTKPQQ